MPLDHYVSQVHLKKFYSPALTNRMYAIRKSDLKAFTPNSSAVCRIKDNSSNSYLREDRAIEEFLKTIEPKYGAAVDKLIAGNIDEECVYVIAGFVSYVITCSPAGMRIHSEPLKSTTEDIFISMDAQGLLPPPPAVLGSSKLTELLHDGTVQITIDPKYPQAMGIASVLNCTSNFANFKWEILHNNSDDSPFFTSDFPVAIEQTDDPRILNRIVPLAPNLAIRIKPDPTIDTDRIDFSFSGFGYRNRKIIRKEIENLNRLIVRCAEDTVFYRDDHSWVPSFIAKNQHYRIEPYTSRLETPDGAYLLSTQRVVARSAVKQKD